jgi:ABC-type Mn2+/Zn2+ transport system permease subunit
MDIGWDVLWELFRYALLSALVAGLVCPVVGCFLLVRRTGFHGVTLPQFAAAGVAFGYAILPWWIDRIGLAGLDYAAAVESPHALKSYLFSWAAIATFGGLGAFTLLGRSKETATARVAAGFAIASALTILFALASPAGSEYIDTLLRGETLTAGRHELEVIAVIYLLAGAALHIFRKDLLLVSYDPETAAVLRCNILRLEGLFLLIVGLTVSVGTLIVGPVMLFGLLVLPPLAARGLAWSMGSYIALAAGLGVISVGGGLLIAFRHDWPLGPAVVVVAAVLLVPGFVVGKLRGE